MDAIPKDVAWRLCHEIREETRGKWYSFTRLQCWGCTRFSRGDPNKMCLSSKEGYRGCNLVNRRYDQKST